MRQKEHILSSNYPDRQEILDYMSHHGIYITKRTGGGVSFYYLDASEVRNRDEFTRLTGYHGIIAEKIVHIKKVVPYGSSVYSFSSLNEAYDALKYLHDIMASTESDADF